MLPSENPNLDKYPMIKYVFEKQVDMLFNDLRYMLIAPKGGIVAAFNLSITALILNIISGFSRRLYRPKEELNDNDRFKKMLEEYFHWGNTTIKKSEAAEILYSSLRNPLTHELGIKGKKKISIVKSGAISMEQLIDMESQENCASSFPPTIGKIELYKDNFEWWLDIYALYWGTHRLVENLISDSNHAIDAEKAFEKILKIKKSNTN